MNNVSLVGRLTKGVEVREHKGRKVANFTLAVNRPFAKKDDDITADFVRCVAWGKVVDVFEKYTQKGQQIGIDGRIETGQYTDKDDIKRYTTTVNIDNLYLLASPRKDDA